MIEESMAVGMELEWVILTIICCAVCLIWGYKLGYRQRKNEEAEAWEKRKVQGFKSSKVEGADSYEETVRAERLRVRTERELLRVSRAEELEAERRRERREANLARRDHEYRVLQSIATRGMR